MHYIKQFYNMGMVKFFQDRDFSYGSAGHSFWFPAQQPIL